MTTDLPYAYDGASGYERFSVPIQIKFSETDLKTQTVAQIGSTTIFETPIVFSDVMESRDSVTIVTSRDDLFGVIQENQNFVGMDATVSTLNWGAALFGMGMVDMSDEGGAEKVFCTRLSMTSEAPDSLKETQETTRFACFRDTDGDGYMDEVHAPFGSSQQNSGYLPSFFMKKISTSFAPFKLYPTESEALANQLKLVGTTNREQDETWLGTRTDEYYTFKGTLVPSPRGLGEASWDMTSLLPAEGTGFADKIDWLGGFLVLSRETEEDPWSMDLSLPERDPEAALTLVFDIGR